MSKIIFSALLGLFLLPWNMLYVQTASLTVNKIRYGSHNDKSRIAVELSGACKSLCKYSLSEDKTKS